MFSYVFTFHKHCVINKRLCTMVCDSKEIPVKQYNLYHFLPIVHSPFSKLVNQIKTNKQT